jgi:hypothetical protein
MSGHHQTKRLLTLLVTASVGAAMIGCAGTHGAASLVTQSAATVSSSTTSNTVEGNDTTENLVARIEPLPPSSLPRWGHEASTPERRAVAQLVRRYYVAVAAADGRTVCSLMHPTLESAIVEDYRHQAGEAGASRATTCAEIQSRALRRLFKSLGSAPARGFSAVAVTHVRFKGVEGFAEFTSPITQHGEIPLRRSGTRWLIYALLGREWT